uniref:Platelet-derived growth factor subunit B n=1 Tax=Pundamilia nyererei TaxID=303518 RepID=A0A3B4GU50_9CICH
MSQCRLLLCFFFKSHKLSRTVHLKVSYISVFQEDALPAALVELVRNSPISSIEDLQMLLFSDSVGKDQSFLILLLIHALKPESKLLSPAQQALCKVRTEVVEVTRAMLDRSNANFLLWPPCVEVQRCSGCCNTKSLQCVPVVTHKRYLQVMKVEYINKKPTYAKAVVSVVDHVECRCQTAPRPPPHKKKSSRRQHGYLHRNQTHTMRAIIYKTKQNKKQL